MKRAVLALLCLALVACGDRKAVVVDCATAVVIDGKTRLGTHVADRPGPWPPIARRVAATAARCGEDGGDEVRLIQFRGVAAEVALAQDSAGDGKPYTLYPSEGFFLQVHSHPLHDTLYDARQPDQARGQRCRRQPESAGRVAAVDGRGGVLTLDGHEPWRIDFRTVIRAPLWHGVPQPRVGQQAQVTWVVCGKTRRVARLITVTRG